MQNAYLTKKDGGQRGFIDLSQFSVYLKKSDIEKVFGLESPKILNVFSCRNKQIVEKREIDGKEEILIDLFEILPFLVKHSKRTTKKIQKAKTSRSTEHFEK